MPRPAATHVLWQVGDRVYLYALGNVPVQQAIAGTVTEVCDGAAGPMCRVHWDGTPENVASWHPDGDVECWTRPEVSR